MALERYEVRLEQEERSGLQQMIRSGRGSASAMARARILLKVDAGWTPSQAAAALDVSLRTVFRIKQRYDEERLEEVIRHRTQVNLYRKVDERVEAHPVSSTGQALVALACSLAPDGHDHWTMRLLADKKVELGLVESLAPETVRLKKRAQAVAEERVVHPQGERRLRGPYEGRAGPVC